MSKEEYIKRAGLFVYNALECLRNEYAFNDCKKCIEICPFDAFSIIRKKLHLDVQKCIACGACIGSCPTQALHVIDENSENTLKNLFLEDEPMLTCKKQKQCLARFNAAKLTSFTLSKEKSFTCNLSSCEKCELNEGNKVLEFIEKNIDEANVILKSLGKEVIKKEYEKEQDTNSRRAFFKKIFQIQTESALPKNFENDKEQLKSLLKKILEEEIIVQEPTSLAYFKVIDNKCTNCGECIEFCPTKALSWNNDKTKILFQSAKCVECGICEDICKVDAITKISKPLSLTSFAYNKAEVLIEHDMQICNLCKCSFSYKGGECLCDRCKTYETDNKDLFKLAYEQ